MNFSLILPEILVVGLALAILLIDLWLPAASKARLGWLAVFGLVVILGLTFDSPVAGVSMTGFSGQFVRDGLGIFFNRLFLLAAILVLLLVIETADRFPMGIAEFYVLILLALAGMMFCAGLTISCCCSLPWKSSPSPFTSWSASSARAPTASRPA